MPKILTPGPHLAGVRMLTCDVDGVLTDGGLYYDANGYAMARFHVLDGMGLKRLQAAGFRTCFVTQSHSPAIAARARALGIDLCLMGVEDKHDVVADVAGEFGFTLAEVCHIADDVNDLSLLRAVGVSVTVPNGMPEVKSVCRLITSIPGGSGAVRELCEAILASRAT